MNSYNPYDLIPIKINGHHTLGRPVAFDSEVSDTIKMVNSEGKLVKPVELVSTCPDCGSGIVLSVTLPDPPFGDIKHQCDCKQESIIYPFTNPLQTNRIGADFLDPKLAMPRNASELIEASNEVEQRTENLDSYAQDKIIPHKPLRKHSSIGPSGIKKEIKGIIPEFRPKSSKATKPKKKAESYKTQDTVQKQHKQESKQKFDPVSDTSFIPQNTKDEPQTSIGDEDLIKTLNEIDDKTETYLDRLLDELE